MASMPSVRPRDAAPRTLYGLLPLLGAILVFVAFGPALSGTFVWDDRVAVVENEHIRSLSPANLAWMFTTTHTGPYQPLAWLSYAIDYQIWGIQRPGGFHFTNVLLHAGTAVLVYILAVRLFRCALHPPLRPAGRGAVKVPEEPADAGTCWAAAAVMVVFALHPLRVESVAWIPERRDVLSGLFYVLTLLAYLRFCTFPVGAEGRKGYYATALACYALSLLSKGTAVSLPLVLVVLDVYPLRRLALGSGSVKSSATESILFEKVPFFVMAFAAGLVAIAGQAEAGAMMEYARHGVGARILVAVYGLAFYLYKTVLPIRLSPLYEMPASLSGMRDSIILASVLVLGIAVVLVVVRRRCPGLTAAGACYLITVFPMLGLIQVGAHLVADRYSYLPSLSVSMVVGMAVLAWWRRTDADGMGRLFRIQSVVPILAALVCLPLTFRQTRHWENEVVLWLEAINVDRQSAVAYYNLAEALRRAGLDNEMIVTSYRSAVAHRPDFLIAWLNYGNLLASKGKLEDAAHCYMEVLRINPTNAEAPANLAVVLVRLNKPNEALEAADRAIYVDPNNGVAHNVRGLALLQKNQIGEALAAFHKAIECNPFYPPPYENLVRNFLHNRRYEEAVAILRKAAKNMPDHINLVNTLAWVLATCPRDDIRNGSEALQHALRVCEKTRMLNPMLLDTLAAAYAETGNFEQAVQKIQQAIELSSTTDPPQASKYNLRQQSYLAGRPYRTE